MIENTFINKNSEFTKYAQTLHVLGMSPGSSLDVLGISPGSSLHVLGMSPGSSLHVLGMSQGSSPTELLGLIIPNTFDEPPGLIPNTSNVNLISMNMYCANYISMNK